MREGNLAIFFPAAVSGAVFNDPEPMKPFFAGMTITFFFARYEHIFINKKNKTGRLRCLRAPSEFARKPCLVLAAYKKFGRF